jgi:hypothetical protein
LARCVGGTLVGKIGYGAGLYFSSDALPDIAKSFTSKVGLTYEKETLYEFLHRSQTIPDVPLCKAGT